MQARPEAARQSGLDALKHATDGIAGTTAVHICFGYAAIIHDRPSGYSFLPELASTECDAVSIETAQSGLALDVLESLPGKTIILGVLDLSTDEVETPDTVAERIRRAFPHADPGRNRRGARLRDEVPVTRVRLRQARSARRRREDGRSAGRRLSGAGAPAREKLLGARSQRRQALGVEAVPDREVQLPQRDPGCERRVVD